MTICQSDQRSEVSVSQPPGGIESSTRTPVLRLLPNDSCMTLNLISEASSQLISNAFLSMRFLPACACLVGK